MNIALYTLVVLIWGSTWLALKLQVGTVPIEVSIAYRFGLASAVLFAWLAWRGQWQRPQGPAWVRVLGQGLCLFAFNFVCFMKASETLTSGLCAVVFSSATLWNALLARLLYGRRMTAHTLTCSVLGIGGLLLLFGPELQQGEHASSTGLLWALAGTLSFSCGNMLSASLQKLGWQPLQTNAWGMLTGAGIMTGYALLAGLPWHWDTQWSYVGGLLYLAIPGSVIAFTAYLKLVGRLGPEKAAYATVLFPIVALGVSTWAEGYRWSWTSLAGLLLVLAGNVWAFRPPQSWRLWRQGSATSH